MSVILSCSVSLCWGRCVSCHANQTSRKKAIPGKPKAVKLTQKNVVQKKSAPDKAKGKTLQATLAQKKPVPDKVENLAKYLAELREVDVTFEKGTAVLEKISRHIRNSPATYERSFLESAGYR